MKLKKSIKKKMKKLDDLDGINEMIDEQDDLPVQKPKRKQVELVQEAPKQESKPKKAPKFDNLSLKKPVGDSVYQDQL